MAIDFQHLENVLNHAKVLARIPPSWNQYPYKNTVKLEILFALDRNGVTEAGMALRLTALADLPDCGVMAQLEYEPPGRKRTPVQRLDWRPLHNHNNNGHGPNTLKFFLQTGTHLHDFQENKKLGERAFQPNDNLPVAIPQDPEPASFDDLLAFLRDRFNITNAKEVPTPPWTPRLDV